MLAAMSEAVTSGASARPGERGAGPMLPDYGGACLSEVVPELLLRGDGARARPTWLPEIAQAASQIVLLVIDGLGWEQLCERRRVAPTIAALVGGPITSVAPTTTATALTSLVTGCAPSLHGIVGYRMTVGADLLNVLRWSTAAGRAEERIPPRQLQPRPAFLGRDHPVVSRAEFADTGFTEAHLHGVRLAGWRVPSSIPVEVGSLLRAGETFVYAYYDGIDKVAHDSGLGARYEAELAYVDRLVADVLAELPSDAVLVVTADHGQVEVLTPPIELDEKIAEDVMRFSGEGRFRWLHVDEHALERVASACHDAYDDVAWVRTRAEILDQGWLGPIPSAEIVDRLGDVALVAREAVAFFDPSDTGELRLVARHGALTTAELLVPLLAGSS